MSDWAIQGNLTNTHKHRVSHVRLDRHKVRRNDLKIMVIDAENKMRLSRCSNKLQQIPLPIRHIQTIRPTRLPSLRVSIKAPRISRAAVLWISTGRAASTQAQATAFGIVVWTVIDTGATD